MPVIKMINRMVVEAVRNTTTREVMRVGTGLAAPLKFLSGSMDAKRKGLINEQNMIAGG